MPKDAMLREANERADGTTEFIFEAPVDPPLRWASAVAAERGLR